MGGAGRALRGAGLSPALTGQRPVGRPRGGPLTLSWTVNARSLDDVPALVAAGRARGYRHFNLKVAPDPEFDVALARQVRAQPRHQRRSQC